MSRAVKSGESVRLETPGKSLARAPSHAGRRRPLPDAIASYVACLNASHAPRTVRKALDALRHAIARDGSAAIAAVERVDGAARLFGCVRATTDARLLELAVAVVADCAHKSAAMRKSFVEEGLPLWLGSILRAVAVDRQVDGEASILEGATLSEGARGRIARRALRCCCALAAHDEFLLALCDAGVDACAAGLLASSALDARVRMAAASLLGCMAFPKNSNARSDGAVLRHEADAALCATADAACVALASALRASQVRAQSSSSDAETLRRVVGLLVHAARTHPRRVMSQSAVAALGSAAALRDDESAPSNAGDIFGMAGGLVLNRNALCACAGALDALRGACAAVPDLVPHVPPECVAGIARVFVRGVRGDPRVVPSALDEDIAPNSAQATGVAEESASSNNSDAEGGDSDGSSADVALPSAENTTRGRTKKPIDVHVRRAAGHFLAEALVQHTGGRSALCTAGDSVLVEFVDVLARRDEDHAASRLAFRILLTLCAFDSSASALVAAGGLAALWPGTLEELLLGHARASYTPSAFQRNSLRLSAAISSRPSLATALAARRECMELCAALLSRDEPIEESNSDGDDAALAQAIALNVMGDPAAVVAAADGGSGVLSALLCRVAPQRPVDAHGDDRAAHFAPSLSSTSKPLVSASDSKAPKRCAGTAGLFPRAGGKRRRLLSDSVENGACSTETSEEWERFSRCAAAVASAPTVAHKLADIIARTFEDTPLGRAPKVPSSLRHARAATDAAIALAFCRNLLVIADVIVGSGALHVLSRALDDASSPMDASPATPLPSAPTRGGSGDVACVALLCLRSLWSAVESSAEARGNVESTLTAQEATATVTRDLAWATAPQHPPLPPSSSAKCASFVPMEVDGVCPVDCVRLRLDDASVIVVRRAPLAQASKVFGTLLGGGAFAESGQQEVELHDVAAPCLLRVMERVPDALVEPLSLPPSECEPGVLALLPVADRFMLTSVRCALVREALDLLRAITRECGMIDFGLAYHAVARSFAVAVNGGISELTRLSTGWLLRHGERDGASLPLSFERAVGIPWASMYSKFADAICASLAEMMAEVARP